MKRTLMAVWLSMALALTACEPQPEETTMYVALVADGVERTIAFSDTMTVEDLLAQFDVILGDFDRVNPPLYTQITDGMRVVVVRVAEEVVCEQQDIAYRVQLVPREGLLPGQQQLGQPGQNGVLEICYRMRIEDGVRRDPVEISRTVITAPQDEVMFVGPTGELDPVSINGTLAYIGNGNVWVMRGSSSTKRVLTTTGDLDSRVFSLSADGARLLFTRRVTDDEASINQLWLLTDFSGQGTPLQLIPVDVLYADWVPQSPDTISYSTGEARDYAPGWQATNDLWVMRIDATNGSAVNIRQVLQRTPGGLYSWWGTRFQWSPDGQYLAWIQADGIGLVNLDSGAFTPLLTYAVYSTGGDWSWRANVSWSPDSALLLTTVHGPPIGNEQPENSPAFDLAVTDVQGTFSTVILPGAGIWSSPRYSPLLTTPDSAFQQGYMAYLRARDPYNSINQSAEYDLVVADRDGSNARVVFPATGQPGLTAREYAQDFTWSPDGRQLALIYQGNLWVVDAATGVAHQLTLDGGASKPVWTR